MDRWLGQRCSVLCLCTSGLLAFRSSVRAFPYTGGYDSRFILKRGRATSPIPPASGLILHRADLHASNRNNLLGRRGVIFLTALCLIATPIGSGFTQSWQGLFVCRLSKSLFAFTAKASADCLTQFSVSVWAPRVPPSPSSPPKTRLHLFVAL